MCSCSQAKSCLSQHVLFYLISFILSNQDLQEYEQKLSLEKKKQESLIGQLKDQLEEMERCVAMVWKIRPSLLYTCLNVFIV